MTIFICFTSFVLINYYRCLTIGQLHVGFKNIAIAPIRSFPRFPNLFILEDDLEYATLASEYTQAGGRR